MKFNANASDHVRYEIEYLAVKGSWESAMKTIENSFLKTIALFLVSAKNKYLPDIPSFS